MRSKVKAKSKLYKSLPRWKAEIYKFLKTIKKAHQSKPKIYK